MGSFPAAAFTYQLCLTAITGSEKKIYNSKKSVSISDEGQQAGDTE